MEKGAPILGPERALERDLELKLLNNYHLKGVKLSSLQNEERIAILGTDNLIPNMPIFLTYPVFFICLGNILYAYDSAWQAPGLPVLIGATGIHLNPGEKESAADKKAKGQIRR